MALSATAGSWLASARHARWLSWLPRDARAFQILFLAALLTTGVLVRDFSVQPLQIALAFAAGIVTQAFWLKRLGLEARGFLSAVVTCCGLSLLLRSDTLWAHPLIAALAMSSKFVLRIRGKHVYNPANLGVIVAISCLPGTWVSPGQWGSDLALAVWLIALGSIVTGRARRLDISWIFLSAYLGIVALRVALLGQSWAVWWHQLGSGALLLFAFFMISDPMTIPDRSGPRIVYAVAVALGAAAWQFLLFRPNALIWALFLLTPLVPLLDRMFPGERFAWRPAPARAPVVHPPPERAAIPPRASCAWRTRWRVAAAGSAARDRSATATSSTPRGLRSLP
jgi:enediyne biosynthesis protein E5